MRNFNFAATRDLRPRPLQNGFVQLALYLMFGGILLPVIWFAHSPQRLLLPSGILSLVMTLAAATLSWLILYRLRRFAKARRLSYVLPVNLMTFGAGFLFVGVFRLPYSVAIFALSFISTTSIGYFLTAYSLRSRVHWIVPGGQIDRILELPGEFIFLTTDVLNELSSRYRSLPYVVADLHYDHPPETERMIANFALAGIPVYHLKNMLEAETGKVKIDHLSETDRGSLIPNLSYMAVKRVIETAISLFLLPFLAIIFLIVAFLIKLDSSGPVFFLQQRVGFRGKDFRIYKFRTMVHERSKQKLGTLFEEEQTKDDDVRITRVGRLLRRYRIDELPQVINVLRGEMSLIGPRPEAINLSKWYGERIAFYSYRHIVRPGLSGWAQVNQGHVTDLMSIEEKLCYDFYYIKHFSWWLDVLIVLKTLRVMVFGFGAR